MIYTVEEAVAEYVGRFSANRGRAPSELELQQAVDRYNREHRLSMGIAEADLLRFFEAEGLPEPGAPPAAPPETIFAPQAQAILEAIWTSVHRCPLGFERLQKAFANYAVTSGEPIDRADFERWAQWWVKRFGP